MKLREHSSEQKLRGAYYTPLPLAEMMIGLFRDDPAIRTVLEPSCGDGVFVDGLIRTGAIGQIEAVTAIEIDEAEALKVSKKVSAGMLPKDENQEKVTVLNQDFFEFYQMNKENRYDLILGNPPYIRYQYLSEEQRESMSAILTSHGMKANKLVNTWVGFLVACVQMLSDNGRIVFVIPAEIMQVAYAQDLRLFLADSLSRITLITFEELVFPDIEQEIVVFIGEKGGDEKGIRIVELSNLSDLEEFDLQANEFQKMQHVHEKWTKYFTNKKENELIRDIRSYERFRKLSDIAVINVGITTGNNKYFSVDQKTVDQFELAGTVRPLIGRSSHAHSVYFREKDWKENVEAGKAAYLIDFPDIPYKDYPKKYKKYIRQGEKAGEHTGYKCSIRERWYRIPSIWVPDAFFLRRNNLYPKFVLNCCDAVSTDTMHRIKFKEGIEPERIALSYYNSISFAFTEICGRSYGGGVLEILPGEVGEIMVPDLDNVPLEKVKETLKQVDQIIRKDEDIEQALDLVDENILVTEVGVSKETCENARKIWKKLQLRRLKRS
ncbi:N-6 DNA methylase [Faecalicatena sp. AGMB00832]|uniref:site-specific DNA-methyltransferase (adenine-specific) n=1 Tax=Faecalicatena faecalis TaxID=2726362 RepID=A0ABS6DB04_9FIRM|nr:MULTISPECIES: N-6 DNA methylase [Faecalicatena]MBU3878631.1 N-6 DNA methylase [Faecalicatena faecalis]MCI6465223.1 N-6 DNA methylase [Faecalicatena sp.]MDY5618588.1 N-6 DNA methylase [Lachnospiraceae bacterium]